MAGKLRSGLPQPTCWAAPGPCGALTVPRHPPSVPASHWPGSSVRRGAIWKLRRPHVSRQSPPGTWDISKRDSGFPSSLWISAILTKSPFLKLTSLGLIFKNYCDSSNGYHIEGVHLKIFEVLLINAQHPYQFSGMKEQIAGLRTRLTVILGDAGHVDSWTG